MGESGKNFSASQNRAIRGLNIGAGFRDYKSRQERLQIMEILGISNRDKKITNRRSDYKLVQNIRNYQNLCSSRTVNFSQLPFFFFSVRQYCFMFCFLYFVFIYITWLLGKHWSNINNEMLLLRRKGTFYFFH